MTTSQWADAGRRVWWLPLLAMACVLAASILGHVPPERTLAIAPRDAADPPGTVARRGSVWVARGGPIIVGFLSPQGPARLDFGDEVLAGSGLVRRRLLVPSPVAVAVRFVAPAGARLVWSPVGRRGSLEYVPATSLSPEPPSRARFGPDAGTWPRHARYAALVLALGLLALALRIAPRLARAPRRSLVGAGAVFVIALGVRLATLGQAGQTWDEDTYWTAGRNLVVNVLAGDVSAAAWQWNAEHPPVTKLVAGAAALWSDELAPARVWFAVIGALGCALLWPIGARLGGPRAGLAAGLVAALTPHLIAHGQIIGHEALALLWWAAAFALALEVFRQGEAPPWQVVVSRLFAVGVVVGLSVSTRFVGGLLGPAVVVAIAAHAPVGRRRRVALLALAVVGATSLATALACWPSLWTSPVTQLAASWEVLRAAVMIEPFLGEMTASPAPWYFVAYLCATAPLGVLLGAALWLASAVGGGRAALGASSRAQVALTLAAWFSFALVVSFSPVRKDGVRYVIPAVMGLSLACGLGVAWAWHRWRRLGGVSAALLVVYLGGVCLRAQPYLLDYYGELVGGAARVSARRTFETAWWGEGVDRAVGYINVHAGVGARVSRRCVAPTHLTWLRADLWPQLVEPLEDAEWILVYTPASYACPLPPDARRVHSVEHRGLVLAEVYRRQGIAPRD